MVKGGAWATHHMAPSAHRDGWVQAKGTAGLGSQVGGKESFWPWLVRYADVRPEAAAEFLLLWGELVCGWSQCMEEAESGESQRCKKPWKNCPWNLLHLGIDWVTSANKFLFLFKTVWAWFAINLQPKVFSSIQTSMLIKFSNFNFFFCKNKSFKNYLASQDFLNYLHLTGLHETPYVKCLALCLMQ